APPIDSSLDDRRANTKAAIDKFIQNDAFFVSPQPLPSLSWPHGYLLAYMAQFDLSNGQKTYQSVVQRFYKPGFNDLKPHPDLYGYGALQAYMAYGDESFLKIAKDSWETGLPGILTDSDVLANKSSIKNFTINSTCADGVVDVNHSEVTTRLGGIFHDIVNTQIVGLTPSATGDFLTLAASLAALTGNRTYIDSAEESVDFLLHAYQGDGRFWNMIDSRNCSVLKDNPAVAYDTGSVIHALSIVAPLTQNSSTTTFIRQVITKSTTYPSWHDGLGILNITANGESLARLTRGYTEVYKGKNTATDLKTYLKSYILNQYSAVVGISTTAGSNIYGQTWNGQAATQFSSEPQVAAISALLSGMLLDQDGDSVPESTPSPSPSPDRPSSVSTGAIIGGVLGGVVGVGIVILLVWRWRRRKPRESKEALVPETAISPFHGPDPASAVTDKSRRAGDLHQNLRGDFSRSIASTYPEDVSSPVASEPQSTDLTVEELLSVLNQRLRNDRIRGERGWDPDESPPQYYPESERR
ncbi:hypothetical protein V5O48_010661, partial [Marasmius crinis-equi]